MHINSINAYMYKNETHGKSYHIYLHDKSDEEHDDDAVDEYDKYQHEYHDDDDDDDDDYDDDMCLPMP